MTITLRNMEIHSDIPEDSPHEQRFSLEEWAEILITAEAYGWESEGTLQPFDWEFGCSSAPWEEEDYFSTSFQEVTASDADGLARALRAALADDLKHAWRNEPVEDDGSLFEERIGRAIAFFHWGCFVII